MYRKTRFYDWNYYHFVGSWAWILHRLSGLALIFYLSLHIWVINTLTHGPEAFNRTMEYLNTWPFKLLEIGLWGVILYHAFNGIRVVLVDFGKGSLAHKRLFIGAIAIAFILLVIGGVIIASHIVWRMP